jgi:hypothetical protein
MGTLPAAAGALPRHIRDDSDLVLANEYLAILQPSFVRAAGPNQHTEMVLATAALTL